MKASLREEQLEPLKSSEGSKGKPCDKLEDRKYGFVALLGSPACHGLEKEDVDVLNDMWARDPVVMEVGGTNGLVMSHWDLKRLLHTGDGVDGWLNDVLMDFAGKLVNTINPECYVFTTYMRECFLMGKERGYRALRKLCKNAWARDQEGGKALTVVPDVWLFPLIRAGDPHWWLLYADVGGRQYYVLDPYSPNSAAPAHRVRVAQELLQWVLCALYGKSLCFEEMEYIPNYIYTLPQQDDGYNCGIYVCLYMTMLARNLITYQWPDEIDIFRCKLANALEKNDPEALLISPTYN